MASKRWAPIKKLAICRRCPGHCCSISAMVVVLDYEQANRTLHQYRYEKKYVQMRGTTPVLKKRKDGSCVYFDREKKRCSIYRRRPRACKAFFCGRDRKNDSCWKNILEEAKKDAEPRPPRSTDTREQLPGILTDDAYQGPALRREGRDHVG